MPEIDADVQRMLEFKAGNDAAFDGLFERWAAPLLRYLEAMVGDAATAEDLVQESFLRVHRARARYEPRARFSTWLYRIATNLAINELKRPRRRHPHDSEQDRALRSNAVSSEASLETRRRGNQVERELARLPERQRVALWMSAVEGHSYAEVAEVLGASPQSVKALVHRARTTLLSRVQGGQLPRTGAATGR